MFHHPLAKLAELLEPVVVPPALNRVEARDFSEVAFYVSHGYRVKVHGHRIFMVRAALAVHA